MGLRIPDDVAIIGFSDSESADYVTPKLSTIADKAYEQGQLACELLMKALNGDKQRYNEIVPMQMIVRESSAKKR